MYASTDLSNPNETRLRGWLASYLSKLPGFNVTVRARKPRPRPIYCKACKQEAARCPNCSSPLVRAPEKGVDTAICTDLLSLAWATGYDLAILVSADGDYVPAVQLLGTKNFKIINAAWKGHGHDLAQASWGHFLIDDTIAKLKRS